MKRFTGIESERLILRRFEESDLAPLLAYRNDPKVARYQSWSSFTEEEARNFISGIRSIGPGRPGEWFQFAVESKETGSLLGDCAMRVDEGETYRAEIGYTFAREHQGRGYATEAVSRLLDYAFGDLGLHRVTATLDQRNERSVALLERLGLRREGAFVRNYRSKGEWTSEYLYAILGDEWLERPSR